MFDCSLFITFLIFSMASTVMSALILILPLDELKDEISKAKTCCLQCASYVTNDSRCTERMELKSHILQRVKDRVDSTDRGIQAAKYIKRYVLCDRHQTLRISRKCFMGAGWCTTLAVTSRKKSVEAVVESADATTSATVHLPRSENELSIASTVIPPLATVGRAADRHADDSVPENAPQSFTHASKRTLHLLDDMSSPKHQKRGDNATNLHFDPTLQAPRSSTSGGSSTRSHDLKIGRPRRRCRRSIGFTPSFKEIHEDLINSSVRNIFCVSAASYSLQRCRRLRPLDVLREKFSCPSTDLDRKMIKDIIDSLLCSAHATDQQASKVLGRWCAELNIAELRRDSRDSALLTPETSSTPSSPKYGREEIDLTLEIDGEMSYRHDAKASSSSSSSNSPIRTELLASAPAPSSVLATAHDAQESASNTMQYEQPASSTSDRHFIPQNMNHCIPAQASNSEFDQHREEPEPNSAEEREEVVMSTSCVAKTDLGVSWVYEIGATAMDGMAAPEQSRAHRCDAPTLAVIDAQADHSPFHMPWESYQAVRDEMLTPIEQEGYVYVFRSRSRPGVVKIGRATNIQDRLKRIQKDCHMFDLEIVPDSTCTKIYHVAKLERLVHRELQIVLKTDFRCDNPDHYTAKGSSHREWFEIDAAKAVSIVKRWREWLKLQPYGEVRIQSLKDEWVHAIDHRCPEPDEEEHDVHDHEKRNQKFNKFLLPPPDSPTSRS